MDKTFVTKTLTDFYRENRSTLLNKEEILAISKKVFSISNFSGLNKDNVQKVCSEDSIIFGFPEGLLISPNKFYVLDITRSTRMQSFLLEDFHSIDATHKTFTTSGKLLINGSEVAKESATKFNIELYSKLKNTLIKARKDYHDALENEKQLAREVKEKEEKVFTSNQSEALAFFDKDGNGEIDLVENDFNKLLSKNQKRVIEIDKNYVHQFVKISNYIKTKKSNTQKIFASIRDAANQAELEERINLLKNQIHSYDLLVFHSINMIGALVNEDLITFYEIYESFDKLGMFKSNWENEVAEKLTNIGNKLDDLMHSIYNMEQNIVSELSHLTYVTQESFSDLNQSVTKQLMEVESSINTNNLLSTIQSYQLYKINKNTKALEN